MCGKNSCERAGVGVKERITKVNEFVTNFSSAAARDGSLPSWRGRRFSLAFAAPRRYAAFGLGYSPKKVPPLLLQPEAFFTRTLGQVGGDSHARGRMPRRLMVMVGIHG